MAEPDVVEPPDSHETRFRVLLAVPDAKNIPYFALGVEAKRARIETEILPSERLSGLVSGNVLRSLQTGFGSHRLVRVRRRVLQKTGVYSSWLAFPVLEPAQAFVEANRRLGLDAITARMEAALTSGQEKLKQAVEQGRFDLGRLKSGSRLGRAQEYVRTAETLDKLGWGRWALAKLREDIDAVPDGVSVG